MQRIRDWMAGAIRTRPKKSRRQNKSYVFFRITASPAKTKRSAAQGVPLVPGRSIAVDRALHAYGTPFFISADLPIANEKTATKFRRLMFAQDTGSAIVGPARADIYFGAGAEAGSMAGRIKNPGRFVMLLPRELDPVEAGQNVRLPPDRRGLLAQLGAGNMIDPTAEEVPLPEPRPATAPARGSLRRKPKRRRRSGACDEPPPVPERRRTRFVDRGCALHQAASSFAPRRRSFGADAIRESSHQSSRQTCRRRLSTSAPPREARPENVPEKKTPPLAPLGRRLKQRVARGREPIDARLDLHGFTQTQAHAALLRFLRHAQADGVRMVLVVTGKGTSKGGETHERGVLKRQVPLWLSLPEFRSLVVGFEDAHIGHGGAGALYVRLRRAQRSARLTATIGMPTRAHEFVNFASHDALSDLVAHDLFRKPDSTFPNHA